MDVVFLKNKKADYSHRYVQWSYNTKSIVHIVASCVSCVPPLIDWKYKLVSVHELQRMY